MVKDFSRLGRNFVETGQYLEQVFPLFGVRFIAIQFIQALLEANGLAAGKDHQFKGRYDAEKNAVIISLKNGE